MSEYDLTEFQKDALKELGNIGAGNAATALSQLLGKDIRLNVPEIIMLPIEKIVEAIGEKIAGQDKVVAAVYMRVFGDIQARSLMVFPQSKVFSMIDLLMRRKPGETKEFGETEQSALKEIGNIIISSYLNAIAKFTGLNSVPSVPALAVDMVEAIFETISAEIAEVGKEALLVETDLTEESTQIKNTLFLIPDKESMEELVKALDNTVKGV